MKAQQLIAGANFDPSQLKAMKKAFDAAWGEIAPGVSARAEAIEAARIRLARIVLSVAKRGTLDPHKLKDEAMRLMLAEPSDM